MEKAEVLRNVFLFKDMTEEELAPFVKTAVDVSFDRGAPVFREGEPGNCMYVIVSGTVRVLKENRETEMEEIVILDQGSYFGEMAIVEKATRSATIIANEPVRLLRLDGDVITAILSVNPGLAARFYRTMAQALCRRLRFVTENVSFLKTLAKAKEVG